jgi:hypothetical protein
MFSRPRLGLSASLPSLLLVAGCFSAGGGSCTPSNGLAGNGSFHYDCVGDGVDPECVNRTITVGGQLPTRPIARTASFKLTYLTNSTLPVEAASTNAVSGTGTFTAQRAGTIGFFVRAFNFTDDVDDAVRLEVADPDSVRITPMTSRLFGETFSVGDEQRFGVRAFAQNEMLAGALSATWEIEPEGIVELETGRFGTCTLRAIARGKVKLTVKSAGLADSIVVDVAERGEPPEEDGGIDASGDAATDADANTDGGSTDASQD